MYYYLISHVPHQAFCIIFRIYTLASHLELAKIKESTAALETIVPI